MTAKESEISIDKSDFKLGELFISHNGHLKIICTQCNKFSVSLENFFNHIAENHPLVPQFKYLIYTTKNYQEDKSDEVKSEQVEAIIETDKIDDNASLSADDVKSDHSIESQEYCKDEEFELQTNQHENNLEKNTKIVSKKRKQKSDKNPIRKSRNTSIKITETVYKCRRCKETYDLSETTRDDHMKTCKRKREKRSCVCEICGKSISSVQSIASHMRVHTGEAPHKCTFCPARFRTSANLNTHKRVHTGERPHKCTYCDKGFKQNGARLKHEATHDPNRERSFECSICHKKFFAKGELNMHKKKCLKSLETRQYLQFKCRFCPAAYKDIKCWKHHEALKHKGQYRFKCNFCDMKFMTSYKMKRHENQHTRGNEREFICELCKKSFVTQNGLQRHKIKKHPDGIVKFNEFKCGQCNEKFENQEKLEEHCLTHRLTDAQHGCEICLARFDTVRGLTSHMNIVHR